MLAVAGVHRLAGVTTSPRLSRSRADEFHCAPWKEFVNVVFMEKKMDVCGSEEQDQALETQTKELAWLVLVFT